MRLILTFARAYPRASLFLVAALVLAGLAEGVGLTTLLPLLSTVVDVGTGGSGALDPSGSGRVVVEALGAMGLEPTVGILLTVIVLGMTLKSALLFLANRQIGYTVAHVATDLRLALIEALLGARWEYHLRQPVGMLANAAASEANRAAEAYRYGGQMVAMLVHVVVYVGVALYVSWQATLAFLAAGAVCLYLLNRLVRVARRAGVRQTKLMKSLLARLADNLRSVKPLKAMSRESFAAGLLQGETSRLKRALRRQVISQAVLQALQEPLLAVLIAVSLYVALMGWQMSLPAIIALVFILSRVLGQLNKVQRQYQRMATCESAYWSLQDTISQARSEREETVSGRPPSLVREMRLEHVGFRYGPEWVLRDLSMRFPAGSFTTIVGASGAGKTTLVDLLMGLVRPQRGEMWIDAQSLSDIALRQWRRMIGYVPQDALLLHDTVFHNVVLGDPELTPADAEGALRAAGVWDVVQSLPEGMYTNIGERGSKLSGGQQQRIAIARALAHGPRLLLLDEATSALDAEHEAGLCRSLVRLRGEMTIVAISHRPALVEAAERVYRLEKGVATLVREDPAVAHGDDVRVRASV
ncbi:MAG: ABC transporter ATP-binding protein [Gammaproteobacteria bacterium]|nr:ABC transporter ATP-binding protein [Gammaproteobacteria bacterium]NIR81921.1 ABC transporter ATP-binding protein [Gammaproteobacteria bacterium]NIR88753.1 ABC transporter ATP-binding protein [Gammaproteobacteria bacterium]NIU03029.1 ABC transporter ATP-binding protein [Gammaproteobacteria bacterium]NIV50550.1 ATP-binding cassette domain-containing protein [Gammaproteobacteria bacterium]